jgi:hypothetical protein
MPLDPKAQQVLGAFARELARVGAKAMLSAVDTVLGEVQQVADEAGNRVRKTRRKVKSKIDGERPAPKRDPDVIDVEFFEEESNK